MSNTQFYRIDRHLPGGDRFVLETRCTHHVLCERLGRFLVICHRTHDAVRVERHKGVNCDDYAFFGENDKLIATLSCELVA